MRVFLFNISDLHILLCNAFSYESIFYFFKERKERKKERKFTCNSDWDLSDLFWYFLNLTRNLLYF
jgi:hypothetical protein